MENAFAIGQTLDRSQPRNRERVGTGAQGLDGATGPTTALPGHRFKGERSQAGTQLLRQIEAPIARGNQANPGGQIL